MMNDSLYEDWFKEQYPSRNSFSPKIKVDYEPRRGFTNLPHGEFEIQVMIHDNIIRESTPGSFRILGTNTRIIKKTRQNTQEDTTVLFLPTDELRFTKKECIEQVDKDQSLHLISYWVFIKDTIKGRVKPLS